METLSLKLKIWRQESPQDKGQFKTYNVEGLNTHMSFLEMLDVLNEQLVESDKEPIAFDHDCREGICGMCSMVINGRPHGPLRLNHGEPLLFLLLKTLWLIEALLIELSNQADIYLLILVAPQMVMPCQ